jgi:hypothetical protein
MATDGACLLDDACQSPAETGAFKTGRAGAAGPRGGILCQSEAVNRFSSTIVICFTYARTNPRHAAIHRMA